MALKICPKCKNNVGPRTAQCKCGHKWFDKQAPPVAANPSGQRGKKRCPNCSGLVGVRTSKCACGYEFLKTSPTTHSAPMPRVTQNSHPIAPVSTPATAKRQPIDRRRRVCTPSGSCPVKLKELTPEAIIEWAALVRSHGATNGLYYTDSAVVYFLREFVEINDCRWDELSPACYEFEAVA